MMYRGAMLSNDDRVGSELGRRIGNAEDDFRVLRTAWNHSTLTMKIKLHMFDACVVPKLLYGLYTTWLNVTERRGLDGFQARRLRASFSPPFEHPLVSEAIAIHGPGGGQGTWEYIARLCIYPWGHRPPKLGTSARPRPPTLDLGQLSIQQSFGDSKQQGQIRRAVVQRTRARMASDSEATFVQSCIIIFRERRFSIFAVPC